MERFGGSQIFKCTILGASRLSYLVTFYFLCWINFRQRRGSSESKTILLLETSIPPCCKKYTLIDSTSIYICHWVIYLTWLMFENTTIHTRNGFNMDLLGFAWSRWRLEKVSKYYPKWWWLMVIYLVHSVTKITKETNHVKFIMEFLLLMEEILHHLTCMKPCK